MPTPEFRPLRPRLPRTSLSIVLCLLLVAACGESKAPTPEDIEQDVETLVMTQHDYPKMSQEEFVATLERRAEAMVSVLDHLADHEPSSAAAEELEADRVDFRERLFELKSGATEDPDALRAQLARDVDDLQRRVLELAHEHVGTRLK